LIDELPVNSKFKAFLISQVPNPVTKISPPPIGFKWGAAPLFTPINPTGFGVKGNAQFTLSSWYVCPMEETACPTWSSGVGETASSFSISIQSEARHRPLVQAQGQIFLGLKGVF
jgi:hypothetical protein